jgi:hemoglobin
MEREIYVPESGPPQGPPLSRELFQTLGEEKIRKIAYLFYENIKVSEIISMYPEDLNLSSEKLADFLIQVMGGPAYYIKKYGPPRMRARHFPFIIDEKARRVWLSCFKKALNESNLEESILKEIWEFLESFSAWMVNSK